VAVVLAGLCTAVVAAGRSQVWLLAGMPTATTPAGVVETPLLAVAEQFRHAGVTAQVLVADPSLDGRGRASAAGGAAWSPLARVFGQNEAPQPSRRPSAGAVASISAVGVRADGLTAQLSRQWSALGAADRGLLVYEAPRGPAGDEAGAEAALQLREGTRLTAAELETLATRAPAAAPLRFLFSQCQSTGLLRLMRPGARDERGLTPYNRCGFATEPLRRQDTAGACGLQSSAPVDAAHTYTGHFLAALTGREPDGSPLPRTADRDGDRDISLHEAHLQALLQSDDGDLPRATSEVYLERWQPLWLRYADTTSEPDNLYGRLASTLAERLHLPPHGRSLVNALQTRQAELQGRLERQQQMITGLEERIRHGQGTIRRTLLERWPDAANPHTPAYARFLANDLVAAQAFITGHAAYATLVSDQDRRIRLIEDNAAAERAQARLAKVLRLRQLARLLDQFEQHASAQQRRDYQRLMRCENTPL
jgi:hypothetical protein